MSLLFIVFLPMFKLLCSDNMLCHVRSNVLLHAIMQMAMYIQLWCQQEITRKLREFL
jgi:hypothetical protein